MANYIALKDGGRTAEEGIMRLWRKTSSNGQGVVLQSDLQVTQRSTPDTQVDVQVGDIFIAYQNYAYYGWADAINTLTITANSSGNPRIDAVVAYVDLAVVSSVSSHNPNAMKFLVVAGIPAGSPSVPSASTIQAAVGAGNPYYILAQVTAANGFSTITNANITDKRSRYLQGNSGSLPPFSYSGVPPVANGITVNWIVPPGVSAINRLDATCVTAPSGSSLSLRLYNLTQNVTIGTVTIAPGSTTANTTSMTSPTLQTGDVIRFDCTAVGSTTAGADVTVQPSA